MYKDDPIPLVECNYIVEYMVGLLAFKLLNFPNRPLIPRLVFFSGANKDCLEDDLELLDLLLCDFDDVDLVVLVVDALCWCLKTSDSLRCGTGW